MPAAVINGGGDRPRKVQFSEFQKPVTLTLTLDRVTQHTVVHRSSTAIYTPNFIEMGKTLWTDGRRDIRTYLLDGHFRPPLILLGQLGGVDLKYGHTRLVSLWSPYVIGQTIIFLPCYFYLLSSFFSSPNLSGRRLDVYHTSIHMAWP